MNCWLKKNYENKKPSANLSRIGKMAGEVLSPTLCFFRRRICSAFSFFFNILASLVNSKDFINPRNLI